MGHCTQRQRQRRSFGTIHDKELVQSMVSSNESLQIVCLTASADFEGDQRFRAWQGKLHLASCREFEHRNSKPNELAEISRMGVG
jgi:hypothetical protein